MKHLRAPIPIVLFLGLFILFSAATAGERPKPAPDTTRARTANRPRASFVLEGLTLAVDLWYDAVIKNDEDLSHRYEQLIDNILYEDLTATEKEYVDRKLDSSAVANPIRQAAKDKLDEQFRRQLDAKSQLAQAIHEEADFGRKYRLLGNYINSLRKELGLPELKFADRKNELSEE